MCYNEPEKARFYLTSSPMSETSKSSIEQKRRLNEAFRHLRKRLMLDEQKQPEMTGAEIEAKLERLPAELQEDIRKFERDLEADGIKDINARKRHVMDRISIEEKLYQEQRFTVGEGESLSNLAYGRKKIVENIREFVGDPKAEAEDLQKVALLSFDANGLKGVNDLSTHDQGDNYLQRIAEVLHNPEGQAALFLKKQGATKIIAMSAGGGDEYGVLIRSEKAIDENMITAAVKMYEKEISEIDVSDLVKIDDPAVKKKLEDKGVKMNVPEGFKFLASASGGGATLYDGLKGAFGSPENKNHILESDPAVDAFNKIMGETWNAAEHSANTFKSEYKLSLLTAPEGSRHRFYGEILNLGRKSAEDMVAQEQTKARKVAAINKEKEQAAEMVMNGVWTRAKYEDYKQEKDKELEALKGNG